jgi:Tfp pilus assembly protein PilN
MYSKISLLPEEFKKRNKFRKQMYNTITILVTVAIALACVVSMVILYKIALRSQLNAIIQEREVFESQITGLKKYEVINSKISSLEKLFATTSSNNPNWKDFIILLSNSIPGGVSISEISAVNKGNEAVLKIKGSSTDNYRLAMWISNLKALPNLNNVVCKNSEKKMIKNNTNIIFDITASIVKGVK